MKNGETWTPLKLAGKTAVVTATAALVVAVALFLWATGGVVLLLFAGCLVAVLLGGLADLVSRVTHLKRAWTLAAVLLIGASVAVATAWYVGPAIGTEVDELRDSLPQGYERLRDHVRRYGWAQSLLNDVPSRPSRLASRADVFEHVTGLFSTTLGALTSTIVVFFFGLFLAADPPLYRAGFLHLFPKSNRGRVGAVLQSVNRTLWRWLLAKLGSMLVVGILTWIGLALLSIPLSFTLALLASALTFVPNVGPIIAAVPAILLGLLRSPADALWVALLYLAIQTAESYAITPIFQQKAISLPPAMIIGAQVLMGVVAGPVGLIVATPLTAVVYVLILELYVKDVLGDDPEGPA